MHKIVHSFTAGLLVFAIPFIASAHEVYVLSQDVITKALATERFSELEIIGNHWGEFAFWTLIAIVTVFVVFFISISRTLERLFDPFLSLLPPYAPVVSRVTIGISFLAAAYYQALFGPELPLVASFGNESFLVTALLIVAGLMIIIGLYTRIAALTMLVLFGFEIVLHGSYMFTYANYLGELLLLLILGAHKMAFHHRDHDTRTAPPFLLRLKESLMPYAFLILRVGFGIALLYASFYAKILHNNLALYVAYEHPSLVHFFGLEAHFLVLGAAIIELLIATFYIFGIEIRFTSLFLLFWLSLSLWYFGEFVWPHVILIGVPISFIFYGYDKYSLEGFLFKRDGREPIL